MHLKVKGPMKSYEKKKKWILQQVFLDTAYFTLPLTSIVLEEPLKTHQ